LYTFIPLFCRAIKDFLPCIKCLASGMNRFGELERPALLPTGLALRDPVRLTEALERLELAGLALLPTGLALRDPVRLTEALERLELAGLALLLVGLTLLRVRL
jgi:hypothetical protein